MPKFLYQATYTGEGAKGLLKEGGSKRRAAVEEVMKALGGKVEAFYYAFGDPDVFLHCGCARPGECCCAFPGRQCIWSSPSQNDRADDS